MDRIQQMEKELEYIKYRVADLERRLEAEKAAAAKASKTPVPPPQPWTQAQQSWNAAKPKLQHPVNMTNANTVKPAAPASVNSPGQLSESLIGKYALPVVAAVLIVFGIGFLSLMAWAFIPDSGKAGLVFLMGILCAGIGLVLGRTEQMRLFKNAMISVALVIVYADVVSMNAAWNLLPDMIAIVLIIVWCALGALLGMRYHEKLFYYVVEAGICTAGFLIGARLTPDIKGIILFLLTFLVLSGTYLCYRHQYRAGNCTFGITAIIVFLTQAGFLCSLRGDLFAPEDTNLSFQIMRWSLFLLVLLFAWFMKPLMHEPDNETQNRRAKLVGCVAAILLPCVFHVLVRSTKTEWLVLLLGLILLRDQDGRDQYSPFAYPHLVCASFIVAMDHLEGINGVVALAAVLYTLSQILQSKSLRMEFYLTDILASGLWAFAYAPFFSNGIMDLLLYGAALIVFNAVAAIYSAYKDQRIDFKVVSVIGLIDLYWLGICLGDSWALAVECQKAAIMTLIFFSIAASGVWLKKKGEKTGVYLYVLASLYELALIVEYVFASYAVSKSVVAMLFLLHTALIAYFFEIHKEGPVWKEVLFCIIGSFNLILIAGRTPLSNIPILMSLLMMGISSGFIFCGFKMRRKGFRVYGLILILISVAKMVLIDIFDSDLPVRVTALVAGGIICLIISYFYNKMEKKM